MKYWFMFNYSTDDVKKPTLQSPVGIIADSHGFSEKIYAALEFLVDKGCGYLIHLGDICDSIRPQTVEACVRPLQQFFRTNPQGLLFRGHSYSPQLDFKKDHQVISRRLLANQKVGLMDGLPCVVTCGASTRGFCMMWMPSEHTLECQRFE